MTGLAYDPDCLAHDAGSMILDRQAQDWIPVPHVETPERVARTWAVLERSGRLARLTRLGCPPADLDTIRLVHPSRFIDRIRTACGAGDLVWVGPEARVGPRSWVPALKAAGGTVAAVDAVMAGRVANAYVLTRPPGHHSSEDVAMGFCLFNNVAIACRHAQARHGAGRVAIVDWDVHHGNGTQAIFSGDPTVLFVSLHQDGLYPAGSGRLQETGTAPGFTVNIPLPAGTGDRGYEQAFEQVVQPVVRQFRPDLILVSAGQDPSAADPLGRMSVTTEGFRSMAAAVRALADDLCDGRLVAVQEGGYSADHMPYCTLAVIEALADLPPALPKDPMELDVPAGLQEAEMRAVAAAVAVHGRHWKLAAGG